MDGILCLSVDVSERISGVEQSGFWNLPLLCFGKIRGGTRLACAFHVDFSPTLRKKG